MKKIIITVILAIGFVTAVAAQPKAIGGRLGWGLDLSYEHNVGSKANFMEASLGLYGFTGLQLGATYNFMIAQPEWTTKGTCHGISQARTLEWVAISSFRRSS